MGARSIVGRMRTGRRLFYLIAILTSLAALYNISNVNKPNYKNSIIFINDTRSIGRETTQPENTTFQTNQRDSTSPKNSSVKYVTIDFNTITKGDGLGNVLFEIFYLLSAAKQLNLTPAVSETIHKKFSDSAQDYPSIRNSMEIIDGKTLADLESKNTGFCFYCPIHMADYRRLASDPVNRNKSTVRIEGAYFQSYKHFDLYREEFRNILFPTKLMEENVHSFIDATFNETDKQALLNSQSKKICVHIRRGDYKKNKKYWFSKPEFTKKATLFLAGKEKFTDNKHVSVIAVGEDEKWSRDVLGDLQTENRTITILPKLNQPLTLAFTQMFCDDILLTAPTSTFGFWMSYTLREGGTTYMTEHVGQKLGNKYNEYIPPWWIKLLDSDLGI